MTETKVINQIAKELLSDPEEIKIKFEAIGIIWFTNGVQNFVARITKTGNLKKHSITIDL